jgi:EAL domain-containing protein (putative c-di-GMP-specific phosphodiesterase class I)
LPAPRLEIELTEDILQRNSQLALKTLQDLQALGVRTVMGSFGTGLASLSRLVNFPFDKIKINRAVIGLHQEADIKGRAIVRAISALGHSLGIATLAEGVETLEQLTKVQAEGCQSVQGFYYSQAVPAEELSALLGKPFTAPVPAPNPVISEVLQ